MAPPLIVGVSCLVMLGPISEGVSMLLTADVPSHWLNDEKRQYGVFVQARAAIVALAPIRDARRSTRDADPDRLLNRQPLSTAANTPRAYDLAFLGR